MDFTTIPDILKGASPTVVRPWTLAQMGELLKVAYQLAEHPILKNRNGDKPVDIFVLAMNSPERFKKFNRTLVERTIWQAEYYSKVKLENGELVIHSKDIEYAIHQCEMFLVTANEYCKMAKECYIGIWDNIHRFRRTGSTGLQSYIAYFMTSCNELIALTYKHSIADKLHKTDNDNEKVKYLLRQKANLQQLQNQFEAEMFNEIMSTIEIELSYHKNVASYLEVSTEIKLILDQFLAEKNARITSTKLLGYLLEENLDDFCRNLSDLVLRVFSYHDLGGEEPERVYHYFLLGVLTEFTHYQLESNKESGKGRFDILLIPETLEYKGVIIEVKRSNTDKAEIIHTMLDEALQQIVDNKYAVELKTRGHCSYIGMAAVFYGKTLFLRYQECTLD